LKGEVELKRSLRLDLFEEQGTGDALCLLLIVESGMETEEEEAY
jgi:hypothetical protein